MAIDLRRDELLSLSQLARMLPSATGGGRVNPATTFRWATIGIKGHKLETVCIGGRRLTTWQAYLDFAKAIAGGAAPEAPAPTPKARKRVRNAEAVLDAAGI